MHPIGKSERLGALLIKARSWRPRIARARPGPAGIGQAVPSSKPFEPHRWFAMFFIVHHHVRLRRHTACA